MLEYSNGSLGILGYMDSDFRGDIDYSKITCVENLADPFTKTFSKCVLEKHVNCMVLWSIPSLLYSKWDLATFML